MFDLISFIPRAVAQATPLLLGSTGETLTEKSGNLNLGIPGIMYVGAISGVIGAFFYEQKVGSVENANANQNVTGLAMTTFGVGFGNFFGGSLIKLTGSDVPSIALSITHQFYAAKLPFAGKAGVFGELVLNYGFLVYVAIVIALLASFFLNRTRRGLQLRAVGENPSTADAAGINVAAYKYWATCVGSMIAGLGGLYYVMDYASGVWSNDAFGDRGWLAIALVIFTIWRPNVGILASLLFGALYILYLYIPTGTNMAIKEIYKMAPFVVTILVLIVISLRKKRENQPPAALGLPYFREDR